MSDSGIFILISKILLQSMPIFILAIQQIISADTPDSNYGNNNPSNHNPNKNPNGCLSFGNLK